MITLKNKNIEEYILLKTNKTKETLLSEDVLKIKELNLNTVSIDKSFSPIYFEDLQYFRNLETLYISNTDINAEALAYIFSLKKLRTLSLYQCTLENLNGINNLEKLKNLYISKVSYLNINGISYLYDLENLNLCSIELKSLEFLLPLKKLKYLDIRYSKIEDSSALKYITSLEELYVGYVHNLNVLEILNLHNLKVLQISNINSDYKQIARSKGITLHENINTVRSGENV